MTSSSSSSSLWGLVALLLLLLLLSSPTTCQEDLSIPSEHWGYVDITNDSHMFFWFYGCAGVAAEERHLLPWVLWSNGGPGGSSMNGDYMEIGPLDVELNHRNYSWVNQVNLMFVGEKSLLPSFLLSLFS